MLKLLNKKAKGADKIWLRKQLKKPKPRMTKADMLRLAGKWGATEVVKAMVSANVDLNCVREKFYTFNVAFTKLMLENGYQAKQFGDGWLASAVSRGKTPVVELLINAGAKATPGGANAVSLLVQAIKYNRSPIARLLIDVGVNVNKPSRRGGNSPLMEACEQGNLQLAKLLLKANARINYRDEYGFDALMSAIQSRHADSIAIMKELIAAGSDVNYQTKSGRTPLMVVGHYGSAECVKFLLKQGANPKCETKDGTPLVWAAMNNNFEVIPILIKAGVNPKWKFGSREQEHIRGKTALDLARYYKSRRVIPLLETVEKGGTLSTSKIKVGTVVQSWKKIEKWLKANDSAHFKSLGNPAKAVSISKLEKSIGCKLPKDVVASYKIHDGQVSNFSLVVDDQCGSYYLLSSKEMARHLELLGRSCSLW